MSSPTSTHVVGANRGIGLGLVEQTLIRDATSVVFATARDPNNADSLKKLTETYSLRLIILKLDMLDEKSVAEKKDAAVELRKHTATLERVVINAGVLLGAGRIEDLKSSDLLENLKTNVVGPHNVTKAFAPFVLASKAESRILSYMSSGGASISEVQKISTMLKKAFEIDFIPSSGYLTTKAALNMLGRQWADVLEPQGVAVPLLDPGMVSTDMNTAGAISIAESAVGLLDVLATLKIEDTSKGMLSYDGTLESW